MQRLLSLKRGSELLKNHYNTTPSTQSICSKTLPSLSKTNPNHLITFPSAHQFHRFSSQFAPASHPWRPHKNFSVKIYGFFSNPVVVKELLQKSILLKTTWKGLVDGRVRFMRHQISNRSFKLNGHPRRWYSRQFSTLHPHDHPFQVTTSLCIVIQPLVAKEKILSIWKSWFQRQTPDNVVLGLILANVAVFMLWRFVDQQFMLKHFTISVENFRSGRVHTMLTSAFSHIDMVHLISNMIGLYFFGNNIGRVFGTEFLVKLYLAGAIVGSIFYLVHHAFMAPSSKNGQNPSRTPGLGASGAVNAIMLLDIFLFPKATLYLEFIIPVPAILLGIFIIGKDMVRILEGDSQISGSAHLGGAVVAAVAWARMRKGRF